jgi:hypothetical protein
MSPKSAQRFWDNDMRKTKAYAAPRDPIKSVVL